MRRFIYIFVMTGLFCFGSIWSIEKSKKVINTNDSLGIKSSQSETPQEAEQKSEKTEKFDNFIDKNNNGIDDRAEKNKPSAVKKETSKPDSTVDKKP
ncbi:MAG: hypothetical protein KAR42_09540 [candidate division Zixibacteria bacterium]|nr:hypothetical protein [candidate division Zixibacteria bacterium]